MIKRDFIYSLLVILFWLCVWWIGSRLIDNPLLVPSPLQVCISLKALFLTANFWLTILSSVRRIFSGFLLALVSGVAAGYFAYYVRGMALLLKPLISGMKSVPVASFVILALIWLGPKQLAFLSAFIVTFPILYVNTAEGLKNRDVRLLEMAKVFRVPAIKKALYLDVTALRPFIASGVNSALGMSWKSGVAAEVIGVTRLSIGEQLYMSKIYLDTAGLFAWTLVIILISILFERLIGRLFKQRED